MTTPAPDENGWLERHLSGTGALVGVYWMTMFTLLCGPGYWFGAHFSFGVAMFLYLHLFGLVVLAFAAAPAAYRYLVSL